MCFFSFPYCVTVYIVVIVLLPLIKNTWTHGTVCHLEVDKCWYVTLIMKYGLSPFDFRDGGCSLGERHEDHQNVHIGFL